MEQYARSGGDVPLAQTPIVPGSLSLALAKEMYEQLKKDNASVFQECYDYLHGDQLAPYAPHDSTDQIADMQRRAITNLVPLIVNLPSQVSFMDGYRRGKLAQSVTEPASEEGTEARRFPPEYREWQRCRMDARQSIIYRAALTYGHSYVQVENIDQIKINILPTRNTIAYFEDPVNDARPTVVLTHKRRARDEATPGLVLAWDEVNSYEIYVDMKGDWRIHEEATRAHGFTGCPVLRYHCYMDDEGTTSGVVMPSIPMQDRVNQSVFSTDVTSTFGAFKVRTAAGLQPNFKTDEKGELILDSNGEPIPEPIAVSQAKMLVSDNPETKFGQLDETPLDGYLRAEEQAIRTFAAVNQFPPHILLGNISNLSAEALAAAEAQLTRFIGFLHLQWGETHEELHRLLAEALGQEAGAKAFGGEVRWAKVTQESFAAVIDGLGKLVQMVGVPGRAVWPMVPNTTSGILEDWEELLEQQNEEAAHGLTSGPGAAAAREYRAPTSHAQVDTNSTASTIRSSDGRLQ